MESRMGRRKRERTLPWTILPNLHSRYPFKNLAGKRRQEVRFANDIIVVFSFAMHPTASSRMHKTARDEYEGEWPVFAFVQYAGTRAERVHMSRESFENLMIMAIDSNPGHFMRPPKVGRKDTDV